MAWVDEVLTTDISLKLIEDEAINISPLIPGMGTATITGNVTITFTDTYFKSIIQVGMLVINKSTNQCTQISGISEDATPIYTVNIPQIDAKWSAVPFIYGTQEKKIELSKKIISDKLRIILRRNSMRNFIDESTDDVLDLIIVNDSLRLASDYFTLKLIYSDLQQNSNDYKMKFEQYSRMFDEMFREAIELIDLDLNETGTADIHGAELSYNGVVSK